MELSTNTDSEQEYEAYQKFLHKKESKKRKIVLSAKSKIYEKLNKIEADIYQATKNLNFDEVKNEYTKIIEYLDKNSSFVTKYGIPKSLLRILNFLNKHIYDEKLEEE